MTPRTVWGIYITYLSFIYSSLLIIYNVLTLCIYIVYFHYYKFCGKLWYVEKNTLKINWKSICGLILNLSPQIIVILQIWESVG